MMGRGSAPQQYGGQQQAQNKFPPWLGGILGGSMLGQGLGSLFGNYQNPFEAGNPFYEKMMGQLPQYFQPWINAGQGALPTLQQQYGQLISDPGSIYNKLAAGYKESPGYQLMQREGQTAAANQSAAGGMAGTPQAQHQAAEISENIANQDFMNYLQSMLGMYGMGLGGMGGLSQQGLQAGVGLGEDLASIMARQAEAAMRGQEMQNQKGGMDWGNILSGIGGIAGLFL